MISLRSQLLLGLEDRSSHVVTIAGGAIALIVLAESENNGAGVSKRILRD